MSVGALDSATISQLKADAANNRSELDEVSRRFEELPVVCWSSYASSCG